MDRIYISSHEEAPEHQALNEHIIELLESYAFDVFEPRRKGVAPNGDLGALSQPLDFSKMMIVLFHAGELSPQMEHEINEAIHRRIPLLGLSTVPVSNLPARYLEQFIKIIPVPDDHEEVLHPLMTTINRHFPV